jgi:hypothetical protein
MDVIRDAVRAALAILVMAVAASLLVEVRFQLAAIDTAARQTAGPGLSGVHGLSGSGQSASQPAGPLHRLGRATLDLADAAIGVVR